MSKRHLFVYTASWKTYVPAFRAVRDREGVIMFSAVTENEADQQAVSAFSSLERLEGEDGWKGQYIHDTLKVYREEGYYDNPNGHIHELRYALVRVG